MTRAADCPFCGSVDLFVTRTRRPAVRCAECRATGPAAAVEWQAVAAWNERRGSVEATLAVDIPTYQVNPS